jgi:hypothetical protein
VSKFSKCPFDKNYKDLSVDKGLTEFVNITTLESLEKEIFWLT